MSLPAALNAQATVFWGCRVRDGRLRDAFACSGSAGGRDGGGSQHGGVLGSVSIAAGQAGGGEVHGLPA